MRLDDDDDVFHIRLLHKRKYRQDKLIYKYRNI